MSICSEGGFGFRTLQNDFIYDYLLFLEGWRLKNAIFKKFWYLENVTLKNFFWVHQWKFFAKNVSKGSVIPNIKKSLFFEPEKIAFKMIYRRFSLGGCWTPLVSVSNRVNCYSDNFPFFQRRKKVKVYQSPEDGCMSNQNKFWFEWELHIPQFWRQIRFHAEFSFYRILKTIFEKPVSIKLPQMK